MTLCRVRGGGQLSLLVASCQLASHLGLDRRQRTMLTVNMDNCWQTLSVGIKDTDVTVSSQVGWSEDQFKPGQRVRNLSFGSL